jgi:putative DNA primase/helicase
MSSDALAEFRAAMADRGLVPEEIIEDGELHRFRTRDGKPGSKGGAYTYHPDGIEAGGFQNWEDGQGWEDWCSRRKSDVPRTEWDAHLARMADDKKRREAKLAQERSEARARDELRWNAAKEYEHHPYTDRKGILPHGTRLDHVDDEDRILVPVRDVDGKLHGLQRIMPSNAKLFTAGTAKTGHFFIIGKIAGKPGERVVQVEGFCTGATVHESTGYPVVVAFDCGNQLPVARAILKRYPQIDLAICADDDWKAKNGNPGVTHATEATEETGARLIIPRWSGERPEESTDMDDLGRDEGRSEVKKQVDDAFDVPRESLQVVAPWPDPEPLPEGLPSVPAFPEQLLPGSLRPWLVDIADRLQCPIEYGASAALVVAGALIGRKCTIRPKRCDDWTVVPNVWGAIVGPPSAMKSPALSEAQRPLRRLMATAAEAYQKAIADHDARVALADARRTVVKNKMRDAAKKGSDTAILLNEFNDAADPEKATERRYSVNDCTTEKLGELLIENPDGLLHSRDELTGFLASLDRDGHENDRAFYLESWDGTSGYTYDRINRGTVRIPALCLSLFGGVQPGPLAKYLGAAIRGGAGDDGLVQRFQLMVYPDPPRDWRNVDRWPDSAARNRAFEVFQRLDRLSPSMVGVAVEDDELPYLRFDGAAQALADEWRCDLLNRLRAGEEHPAIEAHLVKYTKLMPTLALIFHLADGIPGAVSLASAQRAAAWCDLLEAHARRVYASVTAEKLRAARALLSKLRSGKLISPFTARDVYRAAWAGLSDREVVEEALNTLADHGWLRDATVETSGRSRHEYHIHPAALAQPAPDTLPSVLSVPQTRNTQRKGASPAAHCEEGL